ncbi:LysR family transcriptional regulator [Vibrio splendidus]|uniref:LysR family transcriptional regulator n=1 Tax=Vibrio splendidus TaxID=29497 RepID=UPI00021BE20E|nr:LysR family transcriptional regulator [Vibrio splendidus]EGU45059.1 putative transcriptional regulator, LysR-family protein [Vibrio splendidus ATCC 33789]
MDSRFLESLVAVVEEGSIAAAARAQGITPAAISQRIQTLESEFNCKLFRRAGSTVQATYACLAVVPKAKSIIRETRDLIEVAQGSGLDGTLRVGANSTSLTAFIPSTLKSIREVAPQAKFHIIPGNSIDLNRSLINGDLDAAIIVAPPSAIPKTLRCRELRNEPLALIHSKTIQGSITSILENNAYIRYDPTCWGGQMSERFMNDTGMTKNTIFDLDSLEAIAQLVVEEVGVSIVPVWPGLELFDEHITITPITNKKYNRKMVLLSAYHPRQPKLLELFVKHLGELDSITLQKSESEHSRSGQ